METSGFFFLPRYIVLLDYTHPNANMTCPDQAHTPLHSSTQKLDQLGRFITTPFLEDDDPGAWAPIPEISLFRMKAWVQHGGHVQYLQCSYDRELSGIVALSPHARTHAHIYVRFLLPGRGRAITKKHILHSYGSRVASSR